MTYAVISDIHGNYPALKAVIADAQANDTRHFIFLGDYTTTLPFQNKVTEAIRALPNKTVIRGNHEDYLVNIRNRNPNAPVSKVESPIVWSYKQLTPENVEYLCNLPATAHLSNNLFLSHSIKFAFREENFNPFWCDHFMDKMEAEPFTHTEYLQNATESLLNCPDAMTGIRALPKGVHLFGHNHLQFHAEIERRLFVNPGSCGFPNDYDTRAAYTLIKHENNHNWQVTERRVSYNINEVTEAMETAGFSQKFPEWTRIYTKQLHTAVCHIVLTVFHLETTALKLGIDSPFDDAVWNEYWSDKK